MTMTCLIGVRVPASPAAGHFPTTPGTELCANAGASVNCPIASTLMPRPPRLQACNKRDLRLSRIVLSSAGLIDNRLNKTCAVCRLDADPSHHPAVLMLKDMAVIEKGADD